MAMVNKGIEILREHINRLVNQCIDEARMINEDRVVKFNGQVYPKYGHCVIVVGATGSGKGFVLNNAIPIDAKVLDVDKYKDLYVGEIGRAEKMKMLSVDRAKQRGLSDEEAQQYMEEHPEEWNNKIYSRDQKHYDFSNGKDVSTLHDKTRYLKGVQRAGFFLNKKYADKEKLPNVIFDITGIETLNITNAARWAKRVGYYVTLVWVITNRSRAIYQNLSRERRVGQRIFHKTHNNVNRNVPQFLQQSHINPNDNNRWADSERDLFDKKLNTDLIDSAWLVFNSSDTLAAMSDEEKMNSVIQLQRKGKGFDLDGVLDRINNVIGKSEYIPRDDYHNGQYTRFKPTIYQDFNDVLTDDEIEVDDYWAQIKNGHVENGRFVKSNDKKKIKVPSKELGYNNKRPVTYLRK